MFDKQLPKETGEYFNEYIVKNSDTKAYKSLKGN